MRPEVGQVWKVHVYSIAETLHCMFGSTCLRYPNIHFLVVLTRPCLLFHFYPLTCLVSAQHEFDQNDCQLSSIHSSQYQVTTLSRKLRYPDV